jgi:outer membrane lipoprotein SlyB
MFRLFSVVILSVLCALNAGCAMVQASPDVYRGSDVMRKGDIAQVTVLRVRKVMISGNDGLRMSTSSGLPGLIGGGVSALLGGSMIGGGRARYLAGTAAGAVGGVVTQQVAEHLSKQPGLEVFVRTDTGRMLSVVQDASQQFEPGERLYLLSSSMGYRLTR